MTRRALLRRCTFCGVELDAYRAPALRFGAQEIHFFCGPDHALRFEGFEAQATSTTSIAALEIPRAIVSDPSSSESPPLSAASIESFSELERPTEVDLLPPHVLDEPPIARGRPSRDIWSPPTKPSVLTPELSAPEAPESAPASFFALNPLPTTESPTPRVLRRVLRGPSAIRLAPAALAAVAFIVGATQEEPLLPAIGLVVLLLASALLQERTAERMEQRAERTRREIQELLEISARRVRGDDFEIVASDALRPGEEILAGPRSIVPAEGTIVSGEATILPWPRATESIRVSEGSPIGAGATVLEGELRIVCTATGKERTLSALVRSGPTRLDRAIPASRIAEKLSLQGAPLIALGLGLIAYFLGASAATCLAIAASTWGSLAGALLLHLPAALVSQRLLHAQEQGILFPSAKVLDRAGQTSTVVLCARGTVLHGEPEVAEIETLRDESLERVLALAAGAESVVHHPIAAAILRTAEARGVTQDAARHHNPIAGMGVLCVSSRGADLVVGSRELLLREHISIAIAEETLRTFESQGKSALLVAEDTHLLGVIALVDGLKPGARAAVQRLNEAGIEPVLLSGDSRQTTEAVGRALGIDHMRPEVPASDRGHEVKRLADGGAIVAVIGRSGFDDTALHTAHIPLLLGGPSVGLRDRAIHVTSDQPVHAALALIEAKHMRQESSSALFFSLVPTTIVLGATVSLLLPPIWAPLLSVLATSATALVLFRWKRDSYASALTPPQREHTRRAHDSN